MLSCLHEGVMEGILGLTVGFCVGIDVGFDEGLEVGEDGSIEGMGVGHGNPIPMRRIALFILSARYMFP